MILTPSQKLPNNVGDLSKLIVAKDFKSCPNCKISPNLVTLHTTYIVRRRTVQGTLPKSTYLSCSTVSDEWITKGGGCERWCESNDKLCDNYNVDWCDQSRTIAW